MSNTYSVSIGTHGNARRLRANSSPRRVSSFSALEQLEAGRQVLLAGEEISAVTRFLDSSVMSGFELPRSLRD